MTKTGYLGPLQTLTQAHKELVRIRPCRKAALPVWLSYYQHSVAVYEQIAKTDPGHACEALYWAERERVHARGVEAQIRVLIPGDPALLVSECVHEPFVVTGAPSQTIIGDDDHTTCGRAIREVARPQDPQELLEAFANNTELAC